MTWSDCGAGGACEYTAAIESDTLRFDCSFADSTCPSGRRFGELASPARAEQCVEFSPFFSGLCDETHGCNADSVCKLGRCNLVEDLDATGEVFAALCARDPFDQSRPGGDVYIWGFAFDIREEPIPPDLFVDASPLTEALAATNPPPSSILNALQVSVGENHLCIVGGLGDGTPFSSCFGDGTNPAVGVQQGAPTLFPWVDNPGPLDVNGRPFPHARVSAGFQHSCAVRGMDIDCWGDNANGQLDGVPNTAVKQATVPLLERPGGIATGRDFTCAGSRKHVRCWGADHWAAGTFLVDDGSVQPVEGLPESPDGGYLVVAAGREHACAIAVDQLWCWGANDSGQVSGTPSAQAQLPMQPLGTVPVVNVAAGRLHTCAITIDHEVLCWGDNSLGQLGTETSSAAPVVVPLEARAIASLAVADDASCAVLEDSLIHCWGSPQLTTEFTPPVDRVLACAKQ